MNKRLIKFLTFIVFIFFGNIVFAQSESPKDSLWNTNSVLTKKEIQTSSKTGLYSLLLTQPGFIQNKKTMSFRGLNWSYTKIELDGLDIKDPFSGELAFDPLLETIDNITINDTYAAGKVSLNSNQDFSVLHSSAGYLTDGFNPSQHSRGLQSFFAAVSGPILNWNALSFSATAKRTSSKSYWLNGEPVAEFWDGVNVSSIPVSYQEFNPQTKNMDIKQTEIELNSPNYRNGSERTQYDLSGLVEYNNEFINIKYQVLGQKATGRNGIMPFDNYNFSSNILAFNNRSQFEQNSQLHQLTISQNLNDRINYTVSGSYFSKYYTEYDPSFKDNVLAYGDPDQNPNYIYDNSKNILKKKSSYYFPGFNITSESETIAGFVKRKQNYFEYKGNVQFQFDEKLDFTMGFRNRNYEVRNLSFNPTSLKSRQNNFQQGVNSNPEHYQSSYFLNYASRAVRADNYGYDIFGNESNDEFSGSRKPNELNVYGNADYNSEILTVNAQLNYQVMNLGSKKLKGTVYKDYFDNLTPNSYTNTDDEKNIGYNVRIFLPIQENLQFYGNISRENLLPPAANYNSGLAFISYLMNSFSNSAISYDPKSIEAKTINIGMSFSYQDHLFMNGKFFVNELSNLPQVRQILIMKDNSPLNFSGISQNGTQTYKGLEAQIKTSRWNNILLRGNLNYSLNGNGSSSSTSQFRTIWLDTSNPIGSETESSFSGADEYQFNLGLDFHANQTHEFLEELGEFGFNFTIQGNSGYPYTRISGYSSNSNIPTESVNSSKTPNFITYDLSCDLGFSVSQFNGTVFLKVENLTNKKVVFDVFNQTGSAENDGYLNTQEGQNRSPKYVELYNALVNKNNTDFFGSPRTVTFGVTLDF